MPFSDDSSSSSSVEIVGASSPRFVTTIRVRTPAASFGGNDTDAAHSRPLAERFVSSYRSQESLDALCKKYRIPKGFAARPAGDRRACSEPPPGAVCVYVHALEAGMHVPLHTFFCELLGHFGLAPSQLAPNGWRIMVGFVVLCHFAGVRLSLAVFRHFFSLSMFKLKGWYCFRGKDAAGVLFTGLPTSIKGWKEEFFFLSSPAPWPCPVVWGEPSKSSTTEPVLTSEEKKSVGKLLRAHGAAAVDLRTYLCESHLAAAFSSNLTGSGSSAPPPPPASPRTTGAKGMDASVYDMMNSLRAEKAAAQASAAANLKTEPDSHTPEWSPLSGNKRKLDDGSSMFGACSPPGFLAKKPPGSDRDRKPRHVPDKHDGDTADLEDARQLLQGIVTPSRELKFAAAKPSDVVASSYITMLQAANYASFSFGYALELEEKLRDAAAEAGALRGELQKVKEAAAAEVKSAKAAAVREFQGSMEHVRRLAEHALEGYEKVAALVEGLREEAERDQEARVRAEQELRALTDFVSELQNNLSDAVAARKLAEETRDTAVTARDVTLTAQQLAEGERSKLAVELATLREVSQGVCDRVLGLVAGSNSLATLLARVPEHVERSVSEGVVLGASSALINTLSYYDGIDLDIVSSGIAVNRTDEEIDGFEIQVEPCAQVIADRFPPRSVLHRE